MVSDASWRGESQILHASRRPRVFGRTRGVLGQGSSGFLRCQICAGGKPFVEFFQAFKPVADLECVAETPCPVAVLELIHELIPLPAGEVEPRSELAGVLFKGEVEHEYFSDENCKTLRGR